MQHLVIFASQPNGHPLGDVSIAERLRDVGYKTAMVGKWHLGFFQSEYTPTYRGFDTFYGNSFTEIALLFTHGRVLNAGEIIKFWFHPP